MRFVNWLANNVRLESQKYISTKDIYWKFLKHDPQSDIPYAQMIAIVQKYFDVALVQGGHKESFVPLYWRRKNEKKIDFSHDDCEFIKARGWQVQLSEPSHTILSIDTGITINGRKLLKTVTLFEDGTVNLEIASRNIDLQALRIDPTYMRTQKSVLNMLCILEKVIICEAVKKPNGLSQKCVKCTEEKLTNGTEQMNVIRSNVCLRVLKFSCRVNYCRKCQKQTLYLAIPAPPTITFEKQLRELFPSLPHYMLINLTDLHENTFAKGSRRSPGTMQVWLSLYAHNRNNYRLLKERGFHVPSESILKCYRNVVQQNPDFKDINIEWMANEAKRQCMPTSAYSGGIIFEEMKIDERISTQSNDRDLKTEAFVECNQESLAPTVPSQILQLSYLGFNGYRFPFAFLPITQVTASHLNRIFWKAVNKLALNNFNVLYCNIKDGITNNQLRQFMGIHFPSGNGVLQRYAIESRHNPLRKIVLLIDIKNVTMEIRNSIFLIGDADSHTRKLLHQGRAITSKMWIDAYQWNRKNPISVHKHLRREHLRHSAKRRNGYPEHALSPDMLKLMREFRSSKGADGSYLDAAVELLEMTSTLVDFFNHHQD
ncbi:unnamed protein product, partial [Owenia fusiformis]